MNSLHFEELVDFIDNLILVGQCDDSRFANGSLPSKIIYKQDEKS